MHYNVTLGSKPFQKYMMNSISEAPILKVMNVFLTFWVQSTPTCS